MISWVVALALLLGGARSATLDVDLARYEATSTGSIAGRVVEERRKPDAHEQALPTTVVTLVPRSDALLRRLDAIKRHARDSLEAYRHAAPRLRREQEDYERALWEAGAADLVRVTQVDGDGRFSFAGVPRGPWLLIGWHSVVVDVKSTPPGRRERHVFAPGARVDRYRAVTVWLREVSVESDAGETIDFTDRNAWFTGVIEETTPGASR